MKPQRSRTKSDRTQVGKLAKNKMNTHSVIKNGIVIHRGSHRGCAVVANRSGGEIMLSATAEALISGMAAAKALEISKIEADAAAKKARHDNADDVLDAGYFGPNFVHTYTAEQLSRCYRMTGEFLRSVYALQRHQKSINYHEMIMGGAETEYLWASTEKHDSLSIAERYAGFAREHYIEFKMRGDVVGMRRSADLLAACLPSSFERMGRPLTTND